MLYNHGIGTMVADLYVCWAHYYDYCDNFAKTESVFQKGKNARAQPMELLEQAHKQFGFSMSQRILYKDESSRKKFQSNMDEQRMALTSLRAHKHRHVGSVRTGNAIKSHNPGRVEQAGKHAGSNKVVRVFHDENAAPGGSAVEPTVVPPANDLSTMSVVQTILSDNKRQENLREPGPWTKAGGSGEGGVVLPASSKQKLAFSIMTDDDIIPLSEEDNMYRKGIQLPKGWVDHCVPSQNLEEYPLHRDDGFNSKSIPGYDKFMLFPNEKQSFSLEELTAYKYLKKRDINNNFTKEQDRVWGCGYGIPIRLPPFFQKANEKQTEMEQEPFDHNDGLAGGTRKFSFNVKDIYTAAEEYSPDEILQSKWINGELPSQLECNMDITVGFERREDRCNRRSMALGGRKSILPPLRQNDIEKRNIITAVPGPCRKSILPTKSILKPSPVANIPGAVQEEPKATASSSGAIPKTTKRSLIKDERLLNDSATQSPPISRRKTDTNSPVKVNQPKFEILEETDVSSWKPAEEVDKDVFKTPKLPSQKPRISPVYQDEDVEPNATFRPNESCTTQTFNFFIKSQSVSTPKAPKKAAMSNRPDLFAANENLSPIKTTPAEDNEKKRQPFGCHTPEEYKDSDTTNSRYAPNTDQLLRQKLSAILETTEDTNTISSANTISSTATTSSKCSSVDDFDYTKQQQSQQQLTLTKIYADNAPLMQSVKGSPGAKEAPTNRPSLTSVDLPATPIRPKFNVFYEDGAGFEVGSDAEPNPATGHLYASFAGSISDMSFQVPIASTAKIDFNPRRGPTTAEDYEKATGNNQYNKEDDDSMISLFSKTPCKKPSPAVELPTPSFKIFEDKTKGVPNECLHSSMDRLNITEDKSAPKPHTMADEQTGAYSSTLSKPNIPDHSVFETNDSYFSVTPVKTNTEIASKPLEKYQSANQSIFSTDHKEETIPHIKSFQVFEERTETVPKAPNGTNWPNQSIAPLPSIRTMPFDSPPEKTETIPKMTATAPSFAVPSNESIAPNMTGFKIFEDKTETVPKMDKSTAGFYRTMSNQTKTFTGLIPAIPTCPDMTDMSIFANLEDKTEAISKTNHSILKTGPATGILGRPNDSIAPTGFKVFEDKTETLPKMDKSMAGLNRTAPNQIKMFSQPIPAIPTCPDVTNMSVFANTEDKTEPILKRDHSIFMAKANESIAADKSMAKLNSTTSNQTNLLANQIPDISAGPNITFPNMSIFEDVGDKTEPVSKEESVFAIPNSTHNRQTQSMMQNRQDNSILSRSEVEVAQGSFRNVTTTQSLDKTSNKSKIVEKSQASDLSKHNAHGNSFAKPIDFKSYSMRMDGRNKEEDAFKIPASQSARGRVLDESIDDEFYRLNQSPEAKTRSNNRSFAKPHNISERFSSSHRIPNPNQTSNRLTQVGNKTTSIKDVRDHSISLLEPMKEVAINERSMARSPTFAEAMAEESAFSEEIPNTQMFAFNMASIKNSTILSTPQRKIAREMSEFEQPSLHIKDEPASLINDSQITPPFEIPKTPKSDNISHSLTATLGRSRHLLTEFNDSPGSPLNISGINFSEQELNFMKQKPKNASFANFLISEPVTIRPSIFHRDDTIVPGKMAPPSNDSVQDISSDRSVQIIEVEDATEDLAVYFNKTAGARNMEDSIYVDRSALRASAVPPSEWEDNDVYPVAGNKYEAQFESDRTQRTFNLHEVQSEINPFDDDFRNYLLNDVINFVQYINDLDKCTMVNRVQPIIENSKYVIGDNEFDSMALIGRGSFGSVYRYVFFIS